MNQQTISSYLNCLQEIISRYGEDSDIIVRLHHLCLGLLEIIPEADMSVRDREEYIMQAGVLLERIYKVLDKHQIISVKGEPGDNREIAIAYAAVL